MHAFKQDLILRFIRAFLPAITHVRQYTTAHQLTHSSIQDAYDHLIAAMGDDSDLSLLFVDDRVVVDSEPLEDTLHSSRFIQLFKERGVQHLHFFRDITLDEMTSFIEFLLIPSKESEESTTFPHIQFGKVGLKYRDDIESDEPDETDKAEFEDPEEGNRAGDRDRQAALQVAENFEALQERDMDVMVGIYNAVKKRGALPDQEIGKMVADIINAIRQGSAVLLNFSPLRVLDEYTFSHSTNVCILTIAQAMALGVKDETLHDMGVAAMLHDIGKIFIPEDILLKPEALTDEEWMLVRKHPQKGAEYLLSRPGIPALATIVAYEHHMLYDYSGYPGVSAGWRQNICSQMTSISDYFDALRTKRVYRDSIEMDLICEQMRHMSGNTLEPFLTRNFLILLNKISDGAAGPEQGH
ncbi:MAG: HD domain-containing phosphohydrolase [Syntrophales bacterium]|jgi:HD-GYP domain-containing protein (c-di-GMP phosphodiesterase class II)|nr:HD domain-containing protein [Syntrophales bacterium]